MRKKDILKTWKSKFYRKKIRRNAPALKSKHVQDTFGETFTLALLSSADFHLQSYVRFLVICFAREIKDFYQSSLGVEVDFREIIKRFPKYLR